MYRGEFFEPNIDNSESAIEEKKFLRDFIIKKIIALELATVDSEGNLHIDPEYVRANLHLLMKDRSYYSPFLKHTKKILTNTDIISTLATIHACATEGDDEGEGLSQPILQLPTDVESAIRGEFNNNGSVDPSQLENVNTLYDTPIILPNEEVMMWQELIFAKNLATLYPYRDDDGNLYITDPKTGETHPFSLDAYTFLTKHNFIQRLYRVQKKDPQITVDMLLPNMFAGHMLEKDDWSKRFATEFFLQKNGMLMAEDGQKKLNPEKTEEFFRKSKTEREESYTLTRYLMTNNYGLKTTTPRAGDMLQTVYELQTAEDPIVDVPRSKEELLQGSTLPHARVHVNTLHLEGGQSITLLDGTMTTIVEISVARWLSENHAQRDGSGALTIVNSKGLRVPVSADVIRDTALNSSFSADGRKITFYSNPAEFVAKGLPNLVASGIILPTDFESRFNSDLHYGYMDRKFNDSPSARYLMFNGVRYYFGRDKFSGTKSPINPDTMVIRQVDEHTVLIIDTSLGKERIVYELELVSDAKKEQLYAETRQKNIGKELTSQQLATMTVVSVAENIHPYDITKHLPQYTDESPTAYAQRIAKLSDPTYVATTFKAIMRDAEIGTHQYTWGEQLVLANAVSSVFGTEERLQEFAHVYGDTGISTFLSLEQDESLGAKIISLAHELPEPVAKKVFETYNMIGDQVHCVQEYLCGQFDCDKIDMSTFNSIKETILHRAKDILVQASDTLERHKQTTADVGTSVIDQLDSVHVEAVIFTSTLQKLHKAGLATLEDFKDVSLESVSPTELSDDDIANMKKMYGENWKATPVTSSELLAGFDATLENPDARMYTFRHQGTVRGFFAITPIEKTGASNTHDTTVKFTAFNLDPSYKGARIGEEMMRRQLDSIAREKIIFATTNGDDFITSAYIEDGFVGVGMTETGKRDDGTYEVPHVIHVYRNASLPDDVFVTKKMTKDEIRKYAAQESLAQQNDNTKFFVMDVMGEHDYRPFQEDVHDDDFVWVLTRSVYEKETGKVYLAYERVSRDVVDRLKSKMEPVADVDSVSA